MRSIILKRVLPVLIVLAVGIAVARFLVASKPRPQIKPPEEKPTHVEAQKGFPREKAVVLETIGTVKPAREVDIIPQVNGRIEYVSPDLVPGALVKEGDVLIRIDDSDYVAAKQKAWSNVEQARSNLALEKGKQDVAKREWELMNPSETPDAEDAELALRKPQLASAKAQVHSAWAGFNRAKADLERTTIKAPFDAVVLSESVEVGKVIGQQSKIASLAGTHAHWIEVSLPTSELAFIELPNKEGEGGSKATVVHEAGGRELAVAEGKVIRLLGDMDASSQMARMLVEVKDPLSLESEDEDKPAPLMINARVQVEIRGKKIQNAYTVPRKALREGNRVWIMDDEDRLQFKDVEVYWRREHEVLVKGLASGERIVTSAITTPIPGMKLAAAGERKESAK